MPSGSRVGAGLQGRRFGVNYRTSTARKHGLRTLAVPGLGVQAGGLDRRTWVRNPSRVFGRRRTKERDFFKDLMTERQRAEGDVPWFAGDDDAPLDIDAGRSARGALPDGD